VLNSQVIKLMMDIIQFKGTAAAFAEYVINLAEHELAREHRKVNIEVQNII
jgi:hypothetical protein